MNSEPKSIDEHLVSALRRLLRPLVRFLLRRGFTYTQLIQILRPLYVELADKEARRDNAGQVPTDSRVSVMTGIARRYVKELRGSDSDRDSYPLKTPPNIRLVAEWTSNPRYLDQSDNPLPLQRLGSDTSVISFEQLAVSVTTDVKARTLLDDLLDKQMVSVNERDEVELKTSVYLPNQAQTELIDYFGMHIHDHIGAATNNLGEDNAPMFERSAFMGGLSPTSIEALRQYIDREAMKLLRQTYAQAAELAGTDDGSGDASHRIRLGIYSFHEPDGVTEDES